MTILKPVILCVNVDAALVERLAAEAKAALGEELRIEFCRDAQGARESFRERLAAGHDVPIVVADTSLPAGEREALFDEIRSRSPWTGTIIIPGRGLLPTGRPPAPGARPSAAGAGGRNFASDLKRAVADYRRGKEGGRGLLPTGRPPAPGARPSAAGAGGRNFASDLKRAVADYRRGKEGGRGEPPGEPAGSRAESERAIIDALLNIVSVKVKELEDRKGELEAVFKELNAETIQRLLIEREAEKMSRRLTALQTNLKNNLFVRSVLHSIINMLQVQLSIDKEENAVIRGLEEALRGGAAGGAGLRKAAEELLPRLRALRKKTDENIHQSMTAYAKAVQRSLLGEQGFASGSPTNLMHAVERVRLKYRDILSGEKTGRPVRFSVEAASAEVKVWMYDFALVNIVENLLTNSIRKVLAVDRPARWIALAVSEERRATGAYVVLTWSDNGGGIEERRKQSIFAGDSDKTEEGDHGVGLSDVKNTVESAGGFVREEGVPGEGARFVIGFPRPASPEGSP